MRTMGVWKYRYVPCYKFIVAIHRVEILLDYRVVKKIKEDEKIINENKSTV